MVGWFKKRFQTPIERRNYGKLYAGLSLMLFLGTFWAVVNENISRRPWKDYQEDFAALKTRVLKYKLNDARSKVSRDEFRTLDSTITAIDRKMATGDIRDARKRADELTMQIRLVSQDRANLKAEADNRNYLFEHSEKLGNPEAAKGYKKERTDFENEMAVLDKEIEALEKEKTALLDQKINPLIAEKKKLENRRDSIFASLESLVKTMDETEAAPLKVKQVMIPDFDKSNFGNTKMRADRCQTCHLGIDDPVLSDTSIFSRVGQGEIFADAKSAERMRKVFGPHPKPELLRTHNVERFGCSGCHGGQPMSIDDVEHAHGMQAHWEQPLLTGAYVEGSCRKCHGGNFSFASMDNIASGRKLFVDLGCFGCHEAPFIPDFTTHKAGPSLLQLSKKVTPQWTFNWVKSPESWNEHTRMPNFKFTDEQVEAVVAYLFDVSKDAEYTPAAGSVPAGDPARGLQTMKEIGCTACHSVGDVEPRGKFKFVPATAKDALWPNNAATGNRVGEGNNFGPDLNKVGSKVSAAWLFDWVKNPKHYMPTTRMPSLRLTDAEAADIVSYLVTRRDDNFERNVKPLTHLNDPEWIKRGGKLIAEYGCFGCHHIEGMEKESKVSVQLGDFGTKTEFDLFFGYVGAEQLFGVRSHFSKTGHPLGSVYQHISNGEDWFTWTALKMKNSRIFATDAIPQKMPVFNMTDEEAYALTVLLRSFTEKVYLPATFRENKGPLQPSLENGRMMTHWYNCVGCHRIEGSGGLVLDQIAQQVKLEGNDVLPYGPPNLNTIGVKAQQDWFYNFIRNPGEYPVRTWLKIRMPTYGFNPGEISALARYFMGLDDHQLSYTDYSFHPASTQSLEAGREIFTRLKCNQCHAAGATPASGGDAAVPAPNLALAGNRLDPEWIALWLRDPQKIVPGTKMPNFFGTLEEPAPAFPDILGGDWQAQINAVRDYVWRIGGAKGMAPGSVPQGVLTAPGIPGTPAPAADSGATPVARRSFGVLRNTVASRR